MKPTHRLRKRRHLSLPGGMRITYKAGARFHRLHEVAPGLADYLPVDLAVGAVVLHQAPILIADELMDEVTE